MKQSLQTLGAIQNLSGRIVLVASGLLVILGFLVACRTFAFVRVFIVVTLPFAETPANRPIFAVHRSGVIAPCAMLIEQRACFFFAVLGQIFIVFAVELFATEFPRHFLKWQPAFLD